MKNKPIIAVDIDDVLSHSAADILRFSNKRWGHAHTLEDFDEHLAKMWQISQEEFEDRFREYIESGIMETYKPIAKAKEVLIDLSKRYSLISVTSRRAILLEMTERWIDTHYHGIFKQIVSSGIYGSSKKDEHLLTKADILVEVGADYLIDDQVKHCNGAAEKGVEALLFGGYPWNRSAEIVPGVTRADTWDDVQRYFDAR